MSSPRTSVEWWNTVKNDTTKLHAWLQRQYVGEISAVNLLSEVLVKYGHDCTNDEWNDIHKIMCQEALHGKWMKGLMDARGIKPEANADMTRRYWAEVLPNVTTFAEASAAAFHAEHMRLERIRAIANDKNIPPALEDIQEIFCHILPHEEWHEKVFDRMRKGKELTKFHEKGLEALNLVLV